MVECFSIFWHFELLSCSIEFTDNICAPLKNPMENEQLLKFETYRLVALHLSCFQQSKAVDKTANILSPVGWVGRYISPSPEQSQVA